MTTYKKGDLLEFFRNGEIDVICHVTNNQGVMGSGIALQIKEQFPEAYKNYKSYEKLHGLKLGTISMYCLPNESAIMNFHAQDGYGSGKRFLNYEAFYQCLEELRSLFDWKGNLDWKTVGFPKLIGCDRAGGNWKIVETMIEQVFPDAIIVEYSK